MRTLLIIWSLVIGHCLAGPFFFGQQGAAQSTPVEPTISGLVLSLTGDSLSAGSVTTWNDASGNGYNCTQGTAASRPTATTGPNGRMVVQFDGVDDFLTGSSWAVGSSAFSVVVVGYATGGTAGGARFMGAANNADDRDYWNADGFVFSVVSPSTLFIYRNNATRATTSMTLSQWGVFTSDWSGSQNLLRINNGTAATASDSSGTLNTQKYRVGAAFNLGNPSGTYLPGSIAAIRVYNRQITDSERASLVSYFRSYYGI